jgi:hypothetical protein
MASGRVSEGSSAMNAAAAAESGGAEGEERSPPVSLEAKTSVLRSSAPLAEYGRVRVRKRASKGWGGGCGRCGGGARACEALRVPRVPVGRRMGGRARGASAVFAGDLY